MRIASDRLASWACLILAAFLAAALLAGCKTTERLNCPSIHDYSPEFQKNAADQIDATVPAGSPVDTMLRDYVNLRDAIRACSDR